MPQAAAPGRTGRPGSRVRPAELIDPRHRVFLEVSAGRGGAVRIVRHRRQLIPVTGRRSATYERVTQA